MKDEECAANGHDLKSSERNYYLKSDQNFANFESSYFSIEVPDDILRVLKSEGMFNIVGVEDSPLTLCTNNKTFILKTIESSNSTLVIDSPFSATQNACANRGTHRVLGITHSKLQMQETRPLAQRLLEILRKYPYRGPQYEPEYERKGILLSFEELIENMPCSKFELLDLLFEIGAICIDGYWRIVDENYLAKCVVQICNLIDEKGWDRKRIPAHNVHNDLSELYSKVILDHALAACCKSEEKSDSPSLSKNKVAKFYAMYILSTPKKMVLDEFIATWNNLLPLGFQGKPEYLGGIAFVNKTNNTITYFPESSLNKNMEERFKEIFGISSKWDKSQLDPYFEELLKIDETLDQVYLKYCYKHCEDNNQTYYTLKPTHNFAF